MIGGLGIDSVGKITGRDLARHFGSLEKLRDATFEDLIAVENIGEITAANILDFFGHTATAADQGDAALGGLFALTTADTEGEKEKDGEPAPVADYSCLFDPSYGFKTEYVAKERLGNALDGLTVIFTGTSENFGRDGIKDFLTGLGAKYVGSVSSKVDYVITGDKPGLNKLEKAKSLGIPVISERDFREKFGI